MMKKIIYGLIIFFLLIVIIIFAVNRSEDTTLEKDTVAEVAHTIFYAPQYVADSLGYFEEEGLDVEIILASGADKVTSAVLSGDVEIGFCGSEATIYVYNGGYEDYLVNFAGLTKRDGSFIVSRKPIDNFTLNDLIGKQIIAGRVGGMPVMTFEWALKEDGIDPKVDVNVDTSVAFSAMSGSFIGGNGDFVNLFEPNATNLEKEGYGKVVASIGMLSGEVPYTAFYARKSYIDKNPEVIKKFTNAINKGLEYTLNNDATTIANDIIDQFPDTNIKDLALMIERYKEYDCWLENPYISEKLFTNLEDFLIDFNLLEKYVPYSNLVNNFYE